MDDGNHGLDMLKCLMENRRNIQQTLTVTPACYPVKRRVMKAHSVAQGISSLNWKNAHVGQLLNSVYSYGR